MTTTYPKIELPPKSSWVLEAEKFPTSTIRILKSELEHRYYNFGILPQKLFFASADRNGYLELPAAQILSLEKKLSVELAKQNSLFECTNRNNKGIELEKTGRTEEAISIYEENIKPGCWPAMHSFDRLLVYYRANKDYENELRVCKRAVSVFKGIEKYNIRLVKIKTIMFK